MCFLLEGVFETGCYEPTLCRYRMPSQLREWRSLEGRYACLSMLGLYHFVSLSILVFL